MIRCPACDHETYEGALFCPACGAALVAALAKTRALHAGYPPPSPSASPTPRPERMPGRQVVLFLQDGQRIALPPGERWSLGRAVSNQPVLPDIDLSPYGAYEMGVSRLHATLHFSPQGLLTITDMGSSNGTQVDGVQIPPHKPYPLRDGSVILLGKMLLRVRFVPQPSRA